MSRCALVLVVFLTPLPAIGQPATTPVTLFVRPAANGSKSLLVLVQPATGQSVDEVRLDLSRGMAEESVALTVPLGWKSQRDGTAVRLSGTAVPTPVRARVAIFDAKAVESVRVRIRAQGKPMWEGQVKPAPLPQLTVTANPVGLIQVPSVVAPGEMIEIGVLDPVRTPPDGQWLVAGVPAALDASGHLRVQLPADMEPGSGLRVTYFDVWGDRVLDTLAPRDVSVASPQPPAGSPRITGCARFGFLGQSVCVCGNFPPSTRTALSIDGRPATVVAASPHVIHLRLPDALAPGPHEIAGDPSAGFTPADRVSVRAVALRASIDANALMRGESTTIRLAAAGAGEALTLSLTNRTPTIIAIPGGNYQEIQLSVDENAPVERRVNARSPGAFLVDTDIPAPPCPCAQADDRPSTATVPFFVPRRVLATIAAGTPTATFAAAQVIAAANGLAVVDVVPLPLANVALATFEILDGIGVVAKAAALAAAPGVLLAQPDFVYDTSQGGSGAAGPAYGASLIGADVARTIASGDGVRIGVIDAGIDSDHPLLQKKIVEYADVTDTGWTPDAHGTLVAGVIVADVGGPDAPSGIAPGASVVGVKSCVTLSLTSAAARCWSSTLARGMDVAAQKNVRILNVSVGGPEDRLLARMVDAAVGKGIAVVAAAGNDGPAGRPSYPAAIKGAIAVTAVDADGRLYDRATRGEFIAVAAPGVDVLSTGPGGRAQLFSGTSAATAFATGSAALLLQRSKLSPNDLRALLQATAKDLGPKGRDPQFGDGLIDVCRALVRSSGRQAACR